MRRTADRGSISIRRASCGTRKSSAAHREHGCRESRRAYSGTAQHSTARHSAACAARPPYRGSQSACCCSSSSREKFQFQHFNCSTELSNFQTFKLSNFSSKLLNFQTSKLLNFQTSLSSKPPNIRVIRLIRKIRVLKTRGQTPVAPVPVRSSSYSASTVQPNLQTFQLLFRTFKLFTIAGGAVTWRCRGIPTSWHCRRD